MFSLLRPAALADAPAVAGVRNEIDLVEIGRPETDVHSVEADLRRPDVDLRRDSWLALDGDRPVVYGLLWDDSGGERVDIDHYVLPDRQEDGLLVLAAMEARALEKARGRGLAGLLPRHAFAAIAARGRDTVGLGVDTSNASGAPALYARHGMTLHYAVDTWEVVLR
ncbi:GNAT family N-acetyltransferase [Streptomyces sp. NBC_00199]|uniref:GNAT family N-acetyltransferase n=1 Tax=Streptomyces sp. NBC_00199 TaxID=2975678 RepID=UPI00224D2900|nr:GNAT family N-acetyltransferase [Streptomyces sp. NBC_00199]MCX5262982.1 hypothetical protein [Streptomyces sp. NBC_00199]